MQKCNSFCIGVLVTLMNSLTYSNSLENFLFSMYIIMLLVNNYNLIYFFLILKMFISLSCLISLAITSSIILSNCDDYSYLCFLSNVNEKLDHSLLRIMHVVWFGKEMII